MRKLTIQLPKMYGDHHVVAVRHLLLSIPGVHDVYASSSFQVAEIQFEENVVSEEGIRAALHEAGYLEQLPIPFESSKPAEPDNRQSVLFRHTVAFVQADNVVSFTQKVPFSGQPLWPCPGLTRPEQTTEV